MTTSGMETALMIPDFRLPASTGQTLSLGSYQGKVPLVLLFLPNLDSEENRRVIRAFNERLTDFGAERSQVMAVVKETARTVREFADGYGIAMPILADASGSMIRDFEADDGTGTGRRLVILASKKGELMERFDPLPLDGNVDGVLEAVRGLKP